MICYCIQHIQVSRTYTANSLGKAKNFPINFLLILFMILIMGEYTGVFAKLCKAKRACLSISTRYKFYMSCYLAKLLSFLQPSHYKRNLIWDFFPHFDIGYWVLLIHLMDIHRILYGMQSIYIFHFACFMITSSYWGHDDALYIISVDKNREEIIYCRLLLQFKLQGQVC